MQVVQVYCCYTTAPWHNTVDTWGQHTRQNLFIITSTLHLHLGGGGVEGVCVCLGGGV
jgi:hypothetical protein